MSAESSGTLNKTPSTRHSALSTNTVLKLHVISLGCQMSAADGQEMARPLAARGFADAPTPEEADAILLNTCTVRQHAEDRAVSLIGRLRAWKEKDPHRLLIVAGCAAERLGGWIQQRFPYVDLVVGAKSIERFGEIAAQALSRRFDGGAEILSAFDVGAAFPETSPAATAFVTIMRGCNYSCSYCIVPQVRGRELYRPVPDVLRDIEDRVRGGAKEATLLGQTVNSYRSSIRGRPIRFPELLRLANGVRGLKRLRFMSPHPYFLTDDMISAMADCDAVCPALHLPVQSGSDRVLGLMRRNYTVGSYFSRIEKLRLKIPSIVITTDFIVGFPSETDEEFEETLSLVKTLEPASAYCFKYSPREGTEAAASRDDVPLKVKEERLNRLNALVSEYSAKALRAQVGQTAEVLVEEPGYGRTRENFKVHWDGNQPAGELLELRIKSSTRQALQGEPL